MFGFQQAGYYVPSRTCVYVMKAGWNGRLRMQGDLKQVMDVLCVQAGVCVDFGCVWIVAEEEVHGE